MTAAEASLKLVEELPDSLVEWVIHQLRRGVAPVVPNPGYQTRVADFLEITRIPREELAAMLEVASGVTYQNIAEFWNVCTRPADANGLGNSIAATDRLTSRIEMFFTVLPDSPEAFRQWRRLIVAHEVKGAKVHDARLAAIMLAHGITRILTFNAGDFRRYINIAVLDPSSFVP